MSKKLFKIARHKGVSASTRLLDMKDAITIWRGLLRRTYSAVNRGEPEDSRASERNVACRCPGGKYCSKLMTFGCFEVAGVKLTVKVNEMVVVLVLVPLVLIFKLKISREWQKVYKY